MTGIVPKKLLTRATFYTRKLFDMTFDPSQASHGNVKVIPTTVVKGNGDGFVFFQREVALVMSRTAVLARKESDSRPHFLIVFSYKFDQENLHSTRNK